MSKITLRGLGDIGWIPDVDGFDLPPGAFSDALNVRFRDGAVEQMAGQTEIYLASRSVAGFSPQHLFAYSASESTKYLIQCGLNAVYACASDGVATDITGTAPTGATDDKWTGGVMFGVLGVNNGIDVPQFWAGNLGLNLATFPGWNANWRAKALRPFKDFWVALGVTKSGTLYPHMVKWSHKAQPGAAPPSWDEADATLQAGETNLEGQDVIVDAVVMGDVLIIYKERSMHAMQQIGLPDIFRFTRLPGEVGALARNCVVDTPAGHVVLTASDVIVHQGQGPRSIVDGRARRWLFDTMDPTNAQRSFLVANPEFKEVWVCFPETGQTACTAALVWNWENNSLTRRRLPGLTCALATDMDFSTVDPWNWSLEWGVDGAPVNPVGAYEWDANPSETWDEFDRLLGQKRVNLLASMPYAEIGTGTIYSLTLLMDAGHIDTSLTGVGITINGTDIYYFMVGYAERRGLHFGDMAQFQEHQQGRFLVTTAWPRWSGEGVSASYMPSFGIAGTESPEQTPSLAAGSNSTKEYTPHRYTCDVSGRYINYRFDMSAAYPARNRTLTFDVTKQGQF